MDRRQFVGSAVLGALGLAHRSGLRLQAPDWHGWRVNGARVNRHLTDLSEFGRNPQGGVSRVAYSPADVDGRRFVMQLVHAAGLEAQIDPAGNILGRRDGNLTGARPILFGSHIDSVPEGGNYDGDVGS